MIKFSTEERFWNFLQNLRRTQGQKFTGEKCLLEANCDSSKEKMSFIGKLHLQSSNIKPTWAHLSSPLISIAISHSYPKKIDVNRATHRLVKFSFVQDQNFEWSEIFFDFFFCVRCSLFYKIFIFFTKIKILKNPTPC